MIPFILWLKGNRWLDWRTKKATDEIMSKGGPKGLKFKCSMLN